LWADTNYDQENWKLQNYEVQKTKDTLEKAAKVLEMGKQKEHDINSELYEKQLK
jgi:hypothetical protein